MPPSRPGEVTIVSGLPRSGTSMMMRMIAAGGIPALTDGVRAADPDNPLGYFEFEPVKRTREDPSWLQRAAGHVVKMVHVLLRDLPDDRPYAVVMMRRDLDEVLASQAAMLARSGRPAARIPPDALKRVYSAQLSEVERHMDARSNFRRMTIEHARVLADPLGEARGVAAFLGLDSASAMAAAVDPSLYRNRRPAPPSA
jgi:hypothetical protein